MLAALQRQYLNHASPCATLHNTNCTLSQLLRNIQQYITIVSPTDITHTDILLLIRLLFMQNQPYLNLFDQFHFSLYTYIHVKKDGARDLSHIHVSTPAAPMRGDQSCLKSCVSKASTRKWMNPEWLTLCHASSQLRSNTVSNVNSPQTYTIIQYFNGTT